MEEAGKRPSEEMVITKRDWHAIIGRKVPGKKHGSYFVDLVHMDGKITLSITYYRGPDDPSSMYGGINYVPGKDPSVNGSHPWRDFQDFLNERGEELNNPQLLSYAKEALEKVLESQKR